MGYESDFVEDGILERLFIYYKLVNIPIGISGKEGIFDEFGCRFGNYFEDYFAI